MKRMLLVTPLLVFVASLLSCAQPGPTKAASPTSPATAEDLSARYLRQLDALLPGMGAADLPAREKPQQEFEQLCFEVGAPGREAERTALCSAICARLGPATAKPARVWLLRQLERISREESASSLARLLMEQDGEIRDLARRALQNNPAPSASLVLRVALDRASGSDWQVALINAIGARRDVQAEPQLLALLDGDDNAVATAALSALGSIGTEETLGILEGRCMALTQIPESPLRAATLDALVRCADRLVAEGHPESAAVAYDQLLAWGAAAPRPVRMAALRGATLARGAQMLPELLKIAADETADYELRALAAQLTVELPGSVVTASVAQHLPGLPPTAQVLLLDALAVRADTGARPVVVALVKSSEASVRSAALQALTQLGDRTTMMLLAQVAAGAEDPERDVARHSLARLRGEGVDETLLASLKDAPSTVRVECMRGLSARRCLAALPALFAQAEQPDEAVRIAALAALGELAAPRDVPNLVQLLVKAEPDTVRTAAEDALAAVCGRNTDVEKRAEPLLAAWKDANPVARVALVRVLGRVGGQAALEQIRVARKSDDAALIDAAVRALAKWATVAALPDALDIAQHGTSQAHQVLALQGYVRMVGLPNERDPEETLGMYKTAMTLAQRPEDQKLVLGGLAKLPSLGALQLADKYLTDEALRGEAEAAIVSIAGLIGPLHRAEAKAAIEKVLAKTSSDGTRERGQKALDQIRKTEGYLVAWEVSGPYFQAGLDGAGVYAQAFAPEQPGGKNVDWKPLKITNVGEPWIFDLTRLDEGSDRCVYVRAAVWTEKPRNARLEIGSDDAVKAWLNGVVVDEFKGVRGHTPLQDKVDVKLKAGWNTLLLKVVQYSGGWAFSAAVRDPDGGPPEGLKCQAEVPAAH